MANILSGQFDDFDTAHAVLNDLTAAGIERSDMELFALNAPGQHDATPIGGDETADRGARKGDEGAVAGATLGAVAGLALGAVAIPIIGPLAAAAGLAVGAYTGSLSGAVSQMGDDKKPVPRPAGVRLAVRAIDQSDRDIIIDAFNQHAAKSIEESEGTWSDGTWADFDPVSTPKWVRAPAPL